VLTNALDALKERAAPEIIISVVPSGEWVSIKVKDNGCGISDYQKKRLFQPFCTTKSHVTGLGLVIVRKMMLMMGGAVEVESAEGTGTTVILKLPRNRQSGA